jgi:DNA-binding transcriptional regulator YdaS (Cro superfamily)
MSEALLDSVGVFNRLQAACKAAGGQQAWAARHGLSASYVSDVLNGRRDPGESILRALGLAKVVRYVIQRRVNG